MGHQYQIMDLQKLLIGKEPMCAHVSEHLSLMSQVYTPGKGGKGG